MATVAPLPCKSSKPAPSPASTTPADPPSAHSHTGFSTCMSFSEATLISLCLHEENRPGLPPDRRFPDQGLRSRNKVSCHRIHEDLTPSLRWCWFIGQIPSERRRFMAEGCTEERDDLAGTTSCDWSLLRHGQRHRRHVQGHQRKKRRPRTDTSPRYSVPSRTSKSANLTIQSMH